MSTYCRYVSTWSQLEIKEGVGGSGAAQWRVQHARECRTRECTEHESGRCWSHDEQQNGPRPRSKLTRTTPRRARDFVMRQRVRVNERAHACAKPRGCVHATKTRGTSVQKQTKKRKKKGNHVELLFNKK